MRRLILDPKTTIPWHHRMARPELVEKYMAGNVSSINPVLVVAAPEGLKDYGDFVIYNGHHRRNSAEVAGVRMKCEQIETDYDLEFLRENRKEEYLLWVPDRHGIPLFFSGSRFSVHYGAVCLAAEEFLSIELEYPVDRP